MEERDSIVYLLLNSAYKKWLHNKLIYKNLQIETYRRSPIFLITIKRKISGNKKKVDLYHLRKECLKMLRIERNKYNRKIVNIIIHSSNCRCYRRHILLRFYYLGWDYNGFVVQESIDNTIEQHLFAALIKSCCIESRETSNYHRCGRTDKGVSSFSQVISLDVRSILNPEDRNKLADELPYCKILNRLLPSNIRCVAWCPVADDFSARFNCKFRTYKYFFPRGDLNIDAMDKAVKYTIGEHDFRNICKMDVANGVVNYARKVIDAKVSMYRRNLRNKSGEYYFSIYNQFKYYKMFGLFIYL